MTMSVMLIVRHLVLRDPHIAAIADPTLQAKRRWERYLLRFSDGAWGTTLPYRLLVTCSK